MPQTHAVYGEHAVSSTHKMMHDSTAIVVFGD